MITAKQITLLCVETRNSNLVEDRYKILLTRVLYILVILTSLLIKKWLRVIILDLFIMILMSNLIEFYCIRHCSVKEYLVKECPMKEASVV